MTKTFNILLVVAISILLVMSCLALIDIHWNFFDSKKYVFSFTPQGINTYLQGYGEYKTLFTGTVATIAAYLGLLRLKVANEANRDKLKQDRFSEFKTLIDVRTVEVESRDPYLKREFIRVRYNFFNDLYSRDFSILDLTNLTQVFNSHFLDVIRFLEEQNNRHIGMGGIYENDKQSYSFDSFRFVFQGCLENSYNNIVTDLLTLYLSAMNPDRFINPEMYESASRNYIPIR